MKKIICTFEAALQQSTPGAKPIKFGPEGDGNITFEFPDSESSKVQKLIGKAGVTFKISIEET